MGVSFTTLALSTLSCFLPLLRSALCSIAPRVALSHERSPVHSTEPFSFTGDSSTNFYERSLCPGAVLVTLVSSFALFTMRRLVSHKPALLITHQGIDFPDLPVTGNTFLSWSENA